MVKADKTYYLGRFMGGGFYTGRKPCGFIEEVWPDVGVMRDRNEVVCAVEYIWEDDEPLAAWLIGLRPRKYLSFPKKGVRPGIPIVTVSGAF
jgi:hypothetical protein